MFTGIIEGIGEVKQVISNGTNKTFWIDSPISAELRVDQSVSHNGVCLTVEEIKGTVHRVTAVDETLQKTNIGSWATGTRVNLERSLLLNSRLDGHFVQGHVDTTGICLSRAEKGGSWEFEFNFPQQFSSLVIEKGSICVNGISLTAFRVTQDSFTVAIIPFTFQHTNISDVKAGGAINLEFDILGKYIQRRITQE